MHRTTIVMLTGFVVLLVTGGSRFAIGLTLKPMAEDFDWTRSMISLAVLASMVVSSLCMYLSGRFTDRYNLTHILATGLLISAFGIGLISYTSLAWMAFVLYGFIFALGNGLASLTPVGVMVTRLVPNRIGLANAIAISGMGFGQLLMISFLAIILAQSGWRPVYLWLGMANLVLIPFIYLAISRFRIQPVKTDQPEASTEPSVEFGQALKTPYFRYLALVYIICGFQDFFIATHIVAFAQDNGADPLLAGNILALMGLMAVIGVISAGVWSDKGSPQNPTLVCFIIRIMLFGLIIFRQDTLSIFVFALGYGITFLATAPLTVVFVRSVFGLQHLGGLTGFITMFHQMAGGLGAFLGGVLFDWQGNYQSAFVLMLVLSVLAAFYTGRLNTTKNITVQATNP